MTQFWIRVFHCFLGIALTGILSGIPELTLAMDSEVDERIQRLEQRLENLHQQLEKSRPMDVMTVEERLKKLEASRPALPQAETDWDRIGNMVFFRGGGAWLASGRGNEVFTDVFGQNGSTNNGTSGWYVGAGLNLLLSNDLWGMMSNTSLLGEIGVEFKRFNSENVTVAVPSTCAGALGAAAPGCTIRTGKVELTMLTVDIAPKIMFMEGSRFRPWIIPIGLDFHVISPPSNDTTVLDIGAQFAAGAQYRVWKAIHLGVDGRFHLTTNQTDTINNFGTVGGYVGIGF